MKKPLTKKGSKDLFRATVLKRHPRNNQMIPMRGGIRM